jgi:hypothetical protein
MPRKLQRFHNASIADFDGLFMLPLLFTGLDYLHQMGWVYKSPGYGVVLD